MSTHAGKEGVTALHWAAMQRHGEVVTRLLKAGADVNATSKMAGPPCTGPSVRGT